ncbi:MAG: hypothetical protein NZO58_00285 [Gemmataceae bacterium]|nr:hypothetical protein [Gemmataceae bacterium]
MTASPPPAVPRLENNPAWVAPPPAVVDLPRPNAVERPSGPPPPSSAAAKTSGAITVEKHGPAALRQGRAAAYQIVVRNRGTTATPPLCVVDDLPPGARLAKSDPPAGQGEDKVFWTIASLPPGAETVLRLEVEGGSPGDFQGDTTIYASTVRVATKTKVLASIAATPVAAPPLKIELRGPTTASVGRSLVFEIQITNQSKQVMTELLLSAKLGEGLTHPAGNHIEADVGDLSPGASKTVKMVTTAVRVGRHRVEVKVAAGNGAEATAQTEVAIGEEASGLSLQLAPTTRLLVDREGELQLNVANRGTQILRNISIQATLPEGLVYLGADHRGIYQPSSRTVHWLLDELALGENRGLVVRVQGKTPGQLAVECSGRTEGAAEVRARGLVTVDSHANLVLQVTSRDDPLEVGKETIIEVRVQNYGSAAKGVRVQVDLPPGLAPTYIQGPTAQHVQGRTLTFEPIAQLPAQSQAVYHVGVAAKSAGDWRIRTQVWADPNGTVAARETALRVYRD